MMQRGCRLLAFIRATTSMHLEELVSIVSASNHFNMVTKRKLYQNSTLRQPSSEAPSEYDETQSVRPLRAKANVYDAVAGKQL